MYQKHNIEQHDRQLTWYRVQGTLNHCSNSYVPHMRPAPSSTCQAYISKVPEQQHCYPEYAW